MVKFGERVSGYNIPVLNEREVRAGAGLLFLGLFYSIMLVEFRGSFVLLKYFIIIFVTDFIIRLFISPRYSPVLILARMLTSRQRPEYVGAAQKKFAWKIGLGLAGMMFFLLVVVNGHSVISAASCLLCLLFLFLESAFGLCVGCYFYRLIYKEKAEHCPGEICEPQDRQDIQKTSGSQVLIVLGFALFVLLVIILLNASFQEKPGNLWEILGALI